MITPVRIRIAEIGAKPVLRAQMRNYLDELSGPGTDDEAFRHFEAYWTDPDRWPYAIEARGDIVGFALVNRWSPSRRGTDFSIAEFSIEPRARRRGYGLSAACQILQKHHGHWEIAFFKRNAKAEAFWTAVVAAAGIPLQGCIEEAGMVILRFPSDGSEA
jgi:predicted acetyltransferase